MACGPERHPTVEMARVVAHMGQGAGQGAIAGSEAV